MKIPILYEDGEALVINKPGGLPLDRPRAGGPALDDYLPDLRLGFAREPQAVHRLDVVGNAGTIEFSLSKISSAEAGWRMILAKKGKPAITHWKVLDRRDGLTLVEFRPETGRTHQIRVHALHGLGAALLGDEVYGSVAEGAPRAARTMLHAAGLVVRREGKTPIIAHAPLPDDFRALGFVDPEDGVEPDAGEALDLAPDLPEVRAPEQVDERG